MSGDASRRGASGLVHQYYKDVNSKVLEGASHTREDTETWQYIMWTACKCFPHLSRVVWRKNNGALITTKDHVVKVMGKYLTSMTMVAKLITEYTHGVRGSDKVVLKCNRLFEPTDVLDMCGYHISVHYTYTLLRTDEENNEDANVEMDVEVNSDDKANDLEEGTVEQDENEP